MFIAFDSTSIYAFVYRPVTINGAQICHLTTQTKNSGLAPISLNNGVVTGQLQNGQLESIILDSHRPLQVCRPPDGQRVPCLCRMDFSMLSIERDNCLIFP